MAEPAPLSTLADLRGEIDRIDEEMHSLLMRRGEIIDRLIAIKRAQGSGSAFRPGREAQMMRRLARRHRGLLPFDTAESIWRVIISTFTYVQAPYTVHADISAGDAPMRDTARFHFGFTVPFVTHRGPEAVIEAVGASAGDLGIFRVTPEQGAGLWWSGLVGAERPKIIARLPFVERPDHPAGTPVYVVSKPIEEAAARECILYSAGIERWRDAITDRLAGLGVAIEASAGDATGLSLLLAAPANLPAETISAALAECGTSRVALAEIGAHAARFSLEPTSAVQESDR